MTTFINAALVYPDRILPNGYLLARDGVIIESGAMDALPENLDAETVDCEGKYLSPGFIDLHCHGGGGHDFMDGSVEAFIAAARSHLSHGTTTLYPTTLASSDDDLFRAIDCFKEARRGDSLPHMPGLHLEGPYFNLAQAGAQDPAFIRNPDPAHYEKIMDRAEGLVARWSVAPELEGALEMGRRLSRQGVVLSVGHSDAEYAQVLAAAENGYTHVTHYYSCASTITRRGGYRVLGVIESVYLIDGLSAELIADGCHLPPELLRLILRCKNNAELCLVTDAMRAAGMPDGKSILGGLKNGQEVIVEDGVAKMPDRSRFAGSVATADRLVRVMVGEAGLPLYEAVAMATLHPARIMRVDSVVGSLAAGKRADLLLFDENINIKAVYAAGVKVSVN